MPSNYEQQERLAYYLIRRSRAKLISKLRETGIKVEEDQSAINITIKASDQDQIRKARTIIETTMKEEADVLLREETEAAQE